MNKNNLEKKERLEKILVGKSRFLQNLSWPVFIDERESSAVALFTFPSFLVKQSSYTKVPTIKFVWLGEKREFFLTDSDNSINSHTEKRIFRKIVKEDNQVVERIEEILIEKFAQNLDNYHIIEEICKEENYNPDCIKSFKELGGSDSKIFFSNLCKFIYFLVHGKSKDLVEKIKNNKAGDSIFCGSEKDILIIAEPETYRFIKQNDTNNFLKNLVGDIICANLESGVKLIMIAKWGVLVPCYIKPQEQNDYHHLSIYYEISLANITPALLFKE